MHTSKTAIVMSAMLGKVASIIGIILGVFSLPFLIMSIVDIQSHGAVEALILFVIPSLAASGFLTVKGSQLKRRINRFRKYVSIISVQNQTSLEIIAKNTMRGVDFVIKDLQKMITKKYFVNASLDLVAGRIQIAHNHNFATVITSGAMKCPHCGATRTSEDPNCEYCGTLLPKI